MDSDDDFIDNGSGNELREMSLLPEPSGMAKRTRSRADTPKLSKNGGGYAWEDQYQRTWDIVKDDEDERLVEQLVQQMIEARKKKILKNPSTPFQRGIIRTLVVVLDGLEAMLEKDLRPTRFAATLTALQDFVTEFFDQNPISKMGIVMLRNGVAQVVSEVSGLPQLHIDKIRTLKARQHNRYEPKGDPSLQNGLELARLLLLLSFGQSASASKNLREILILFGAIFTLDPGDIHATINDLVKEEIRVKIIGLSAQVAICQEIVSKTNHNALSQNYGVIMNEMHLRELLMACVEPLAVLLRSVEAVTEKEDGVPLIKMGFPTKYQGTVVSSSGGVTANFPHLCACHPTHGSNELKEPVVLETQALSDIGYICPQCRSRVCNLPTVCPVCGLMLILSTHLARSYHHLVPLVDYKTVAVADSYTSRSCYGCLLQFPEALDPAATSSRYRCGKCSNDFCIDCDVFVHEVLHNCPGCESQKK